MDHIIREDNEANEFDYLLQWKWPPHIEDSLRRMLWTSLVEACELNCPAHKHTALLRLQIASYPDAPPVVLDALADDPDNKVLIRIAENPKTSVLTLTRLARHECPEIRLAVAENCHLPLVVMNILADDANADVCYAMAENTTLPPKLLRQLAEHENPYVAARARKTLDRRAPKVTKHLPIWPDQQRRAE